MKADSTFVFSGLKSGKDAFTLVELMVVMAIITILVGSSMAAINAMSAGQTMGGVSNTISTTLEKARTVAMAHNTYVWVGFYTQVDSSNNPTGLVIAAVESITGQATDLGSPTNLNPIMKPFFAPNVNLSSLANLNSINSNFYNNLVSDPQGPLAYTDLYGDGLAIGSFNLSITGVSTKFTQIIQFNSQGEAIAQSNISKWINLGLVPIHGKSTNVADIQVAGTTGAVQLFQP